MAITSLTICNSALIKIGAPRISSLAEATKQARLANEQYEKLRDEVLTQHPWNFAMERDSVAVDATAPEYGYDYRYALPANCLRVFKMEYSDIEYKVEGRYILTNEGSPLNFQYIKQETDTSKFTPIFAEALACRMAADLAYALMNNAALQSSMMALYEYQIKLARSMDAQEGTPDPIEADTWINSRW